MKSKVAITLVGLYLIVALGAVAYAATCSGIFCGLIMLGPIMPWPFILEGILGDSYFLYWILVLLNSALIYLIGLTIAHLLGMVTTRRNKKSAS